MFQFKLPLPLHANACNLRLVPPASALLSLPKHTAPHNSSSSSSKIPHHSNRLTCNHQMKITYDVIQSRTSQRIRHSETIEQVPSTARI